MPVSRRSFILGSLSASALSGLGGGALARLPSAIKAVPLPEAATAGNVILAPDAVVREALRLFEKSLGATAPQIKNPDA